MTEPEKVIAPTAAPITFQSSYQFYTSGVPKLNTSGFKKAITANTAANSTNLETQQLILAAVIVILYAIKAQLIHLLK